MELGGSSPSSPTKKLIFFVIKVVFSIEPNIYNKKGYERKNNRIKKTRLHIQTNNK